MGAEREQQVAREPGSTDWRLTAGSWSQCMRRIERRLSKNLKICESVSETSGARPPRAQLSACRAVASERRLAPSRRVEAKRRRTRKTSDAPKSWKYCESLVLPRAVSGGVSSNARGGRAPQPLFPRFIVRLPDCSRRLGRGQFSHHRFRRGPHIVGLGQNRCITPFDEGGGRFVQKTGGQHELGFRPARRNLFD